MLQFCFYKEKIVLTFESLEKMFWGVSNMYNKSEPFFFIMFRYVCKRKREGWLIMDDLGKQAIDIIYIIKHVPIQ